jgi:hypothetical protein
MLFPKILAAILFLMVFGLIFSRAATSPIVNTLPLSGSGPRLLPTARQCTSTARHGRIARATTSASRASSGRWRSKLDDARGRRPRSDQPEGNVRCRATDLPGQTLYFMSINRPGALVRVTSVTATTSTVCGNRRKIWGTFQHPILGPLSHV